MDTTKITLPNLRRLTLLYLPGLKTICSKVIVCDSLERISIFRSPKLKRLPLSLCPFLMDNYLLPLLFNTLEDLKNGGNHWSGTLLTLRKSFNPLSIFPKHGYVSLFTLTSFVFLLFYGYFFYYHLIYLFLNSLLDWTNHLLITSSR